MKVRMDKVKPLVFREDGHELEVHYANRGEPYRDGVELSFSRTDYSTPGTWVLLDRAEVRQLRDKLTEFLEPPNDNRQY